VLRGTLFPLPTWRQTKHVTCEQDRHWPPKVGNPRCAGAIVGHKAAKEGVTGRDACASGCGWLAANQRSHNRGTKQIRGVSGMSWKAKHLGKQ